jgi:Kef-type K+ transport system membrane component KefB
MNNVELAVQFFLQIAVILFSCRVAGIVALRFGQPQVVAEMVTGVLLGPSLFGLLLPEMQAAIFPWDPGQGTRDTQSYLFPASQLGLALYMFIVGLEFRVDIVRSQMKASSAVAIVGMAAPFLLGAIAGWLCHQHTDLFPEKTSAFEASIFTGASMCITAFPMLARIIHFKGLTGTTMGTVAIGAGAINDAAAWCLLAVVLASFDGEWNSAVLTIGGGLLFVLLASFVVRPIIALTHRLMVTDENSLSETGLTMALTLLAAGAWFTDLIGLHAVFGAFVVGAIMPRGIISRDLVNRIQPLAVALLLPLFFVYSGLNTRIGLLNNTYLWAICGLIVLVAILGKGVACWLAALASGLSQRESLGIGVLMNARGLMELIIINIGLQRGIITPSFFSILVIMAVITTLMASPLFDRLVGKSGATMPAQ